MNTPTPETDVFFQHISVHSIITDFARKLERERNEARAICDERAIHILEQQIRHNAERDQFRKELADLRKLHSTVTDNPQENAFYKRYGE